MGKSAGGLWRELRRRRVVSTAAAYAAAAFVLLQLGEILLPAFGFGPSALQALFWIILAAFPAVVAFSWVYDVTRSGLKRTEPADQLETSDGPHRVPPAIAFTAGLLMSVLLGAVGWRVISDGETAARPPSSASIAVLPFADMSPEGDQAYLGDGLAEEVLNILAGVDGLQVAARTSSFAFRDGAMSATEIGRQLNVTTLLEGSVRRDAERIRVTAQLVDTQTGFHVWSRTFESDRSDVFAVQDSISTSIVEELLGRLDLPSSRGVRHVPSEAARDAYYRGRAQWNRRDATAIPNAVRLFQEAVTLDSLYAEAYAGLADSYALMPQFVLSVSAVGAWQKAEEFASRAIALNPNLAEAHTSLGLVKAFRRDRAAAMQAFGRALELSPSYAPALHWRANVLADLGRLDDALRDVRQAATIDALSPAIAADYGNLLLWSGDVDGAKEQFDRALDSEFGFASALFGEALIALEREAQVPLLMQLTQWAAISNLPPNLARELVGPMIAFRRLGVAADPPKALSDLADRGTVASGTLAALYALIGARDETFDWLRRAAADGSWVTQYIAVNSVYAPYRDDPEFLEVLSLIGS